MKTMFFKSPVDFRTWLARHHANAKEAWVGFYKRSSGRPSITWPEAVDQALCFGWIDGVRKRIDDTRYTIRFTPRRPTSIWSIVNVKRVGELTNLGLMRSAGRVAFAARDPMRSGRYAYEQRRPTLSRRYAQVLRTNKKAWAYFQRRPPWYQRTASHWVMSAKKEETRRKRLATLIEDSAHGRTITGLTRPRD
jgi:uncharacterized protein YdeI (YjbR/CyaY-like superfamily)